MDANRKKRNSQRGNSFSTCLLTCIVVFGGLGFYYFNYFQWRHFEAPTDGLTYVNDADAPQLNEFRKRTVSSVTDPLRQQIDKYKKVRGKTVVKGKKERQVYPEMEQDLIEIRNRLKEIMTEARLRRIPKKFKAKYEPCMYAMQDLFRSINEFEDSFEQETQGAKDKMYKDSLTKLKSAVKKNNETREFFTSEDWQY
ncbi:MAG: hypothetical protein KC800_01765 [Candidatus Eremiobacteraeota bacterium]|nr:hypothetical protein [Candidatus Eremiobacteraeota bacterium]